MNPNEWLGELKELTELEYNKAEDDAKELIRRKIGEQPKLEDFRNKVGGQFNLIVLMMAVAFIGALAVSTLDIIKFVGGEVYDNAYMTSQTIGYIGIPINIEVKSWVFQIAFVLLAEFSTILFLTRWRQEVKTSEYQTFNLFGLHINKNVVKFVSQFFNIYFMLASVSIGFVFYANWQSGVHWLLAILPPIVTLGVGWVFEELITDWLSQREKDEKEFLLVYNDWKLYTREPESHRNYQEMLMRAIWNRIKGKNQRYNIDLDVQADWKIQAVNRELQKAEWAKNAIVRQQFNYEHPELDTNDIKQMSNLEILRDRMDNWKKGDGLIEVGEYIVDMKKLTLKNTKTGVTEEAQSIRGLKSKVTSKMRGVIE